MDYEKKLQALGSTLPSPPKPVATYVPAVRSGNLLFLSGMIPMVEGKMAMVGKLGKELTVEQGQQAARITLLNALAVIKAELGSLDQVRRIVRIGVHVASAEGFTQQPAVANGASDLLVQIFGDAGRHARLALGAVELPLGAPVELEMIVEIR
ncbi:MAG: RidA family protein [Candidatus Manganitrophus sp.]|nr:RidA family protein [Candidatus Manganitrophus sp.]MDC4224441.1 RidA family protein [Candidatus Manganitrophus sp.]WDT70531.1 MAG: RidA family protein [Candidatus Manganitrophus sp.]WDT82218.1 MAG: RidA family protein [Candidatus Manganitrophus sp.]